MRLQQVTGRPFTITCHACGRRAVAGDKAEEYRDRVPGPVFADLDGEPFKAYYCSECQNG